MAKPAKPIAVIKAEGKTHLTKEQIRAREEAEAALKGGTDKIICPEWLDDVGKQTWHALANELGNLDLMTNNDIYALAMAADAYSKYVEATESINKEGLTMEYTNAAGATNTVKNPNIEIANKYFQQFKSLCTEFGLTPAARARLALSKDEKEKDEFEEMFE